MPDEPTKEGLNRLSLEERQDSMNVPFLKEEIGSTGSHHGIPMLAWVIYDFGVGNADPFINGNMKGPFAIRNFFKERFEKFAEQNIWVDLEIYGYSDSSGPEDVNSELRQERAINAAEAFIPSLDGRKQNWVRKKAPFTIVKSPVNIKTIAKAPKDYFLADNDFAVGRAKNRSVIIKELAMHDVEAPGGVWLFGQDLEHKKNQVKAEIDDLRESNNKFDRFKVIAFDLWQNPSSDLRIFAQSDIKTAIAENTDPEAEMSVKWDFWSNTAPVGKHPLTYITDYRPVLSNALESGETDVQGVLSTLENLFRQLFGGIDALTYDLDRVSGISNNAYYISARIRDWLVVQQQQKNSVYNSALQFRDELR